MEECCGINLEQEMTIENLYCFIRASLQALQSTGGYGRRILYVRYVEKRLI